MLNSQTLSSVFDDLSYAGRLRALQTGPFGRCVYRCGSDMVDYQAVNLEFESGASAALVMDGHSDDQSRTVRYDGTRATLLGKFALGRKDTIEIHDRLTGRIERVAPAPGGGDHHGGGDAGVMASFVRAVRDPSSSLSTARESLESHLMAFAAEESRASRTMVSIDEFRRRAEVMPRP